MDKETRRLVLQALNAEMDRAVFAALDAVEGASTRLGWWQCRHEHTNYIGPQDGAAPLEPVEKGLAQAEKNLAFTKQHHGENIGKWRVAILDIMDDE